MSDEKQTSRPIQEEQIGQIAERVKILCDQSSIRAIAKKSGVSAGTLHNYLNSDGLRTIENLIAIAEAGGRSLSWLLGAETAAHPVSNLQDSNGKYGNSLDRALLVSVMNAIDEGLAVTGRTLPNDRKVELAFALYDIFAESDKRPDTATILPFLKLA